MSEVISNEIDKLFRERVIDNRKVSMVAAISYLMEETVFFDMAVGYFYISGFEVIKESFQKLMEKENSKVRILMGNETNTLTVEVLSAGLSPKEATLHDIEKEVPHMSRSLIHDIVRWMKEGRIEVKVYTGKANYFHAKSYLFGRDEHGRRGTAIVGSSNFSRLGLQGNTELNTMSEDNFYALHQWFNEIWNSDEVSDFSPELMKALEEKVPEIRNENVEYYLPSLATYLEFARRYATPPLEYGSEGFWSTLYPHQRIGVAECVNRIRRFGTALLCDGVGLGKTRTAAGVIRALGVEKVLLLASSKLHKQWQSELMAVGVDINKITFMSKETFARLSAKALRELCEHQLVIIDEAHQGFKNNGTKMYRNMEYMLKHATEPIMGLMLTATPWNNSRRDVFNLGRLFLQSEKVPLSKAYAQYLNFSPRKAAKAFEQDDIAFASFWEDLFLQRTRKTYGGKEVVFAKRNFPTVKIVYEPKKQQALEDNFERISMLHLPYMDPLRYLDGEGDSFASDRLKLLFLKRADSSWNAFYSTLTKIYQRLQRVVKDMEYIQSDSDEIKTRFRQWLSQSYQITERFDDLFTIASIDVEDDLTDFEVASLENRARYVRKMNQRIESISKAEAKRATKLILQDAKQDLRILDSIRDDLEEAFARIDEKYLAVRDAVHQAVRNGDKVLLVSQFKDTSLYYFEKFIQDDLLKDIRIGHVAGESDYCMIGPLKVPSSKEEILSRFSPISKNAPQYKGSEQELDVVIGTETLSVGQNLQDCRVIMNLDLPFNPMVLEQRIGRIDRPRQDGQVRFIDIYTFPSMPVIEAELKMIERLKRKLEGIFTDTRFDDLVLPEYEEFLRKTLRSRKDSGQAVGEMLDATLDKHTAPVHSEKHSAEYTEMQKRMWNFVQHAKQLKLPMNIALDKASIKTHGDSVAIVKTYLRDINGNDIETITQPIHLDTLESNLVRIEKAWYEALNGYARSTLDVPKEKAIQAWEEKQKKLADITLKAVEAYNRRIGVSKEIESKIVEKRSKELAAEIVKQIKGPNAKVIADQIKQAGYEPKMLKKVADAIQYIDSKDPEFADVLDLRQDISLLWKNFGYYVERFLDDPDPRSENQQKSGTTQGRIAVVEKSESVWEIGHIGIT